jgi:hypothetical protein
MRELNFPFDGKDIIRRRLALKKALLSDGTVRVKKKVAVLGGSTTNHIVSALELFLLNFGIEPEFYQSEYNKFYEDAVFGNPELDSFCPDIICPKVLLKSPRAYSSALMSSSAYSDRSGKALYIAIPAP